MLYASKSSYITGFQAPIQDFSVYFVDFHQSRVIKLKVLACAIHSTNPSRSKIIPIFCVAFLLSAKAFGMEVTRVLVNFVRVSFSDFRMISKIRNQESAKLIVL